MLFMGDQKNSVVRYNVSARDGFGNSGTSADIAGLGKPYTYAQQSVFHYWNKADNATMPTIYNNTIYVGLGYVTSLFGEGKAQDNTGVIARLHNNLVVKEGAGKLTFLSHYNTDGSPAKETRMDSDVAPIERLVTHNVLPEQLVRLLYRKDSFTAGANVIQVSAEKNPALQTSANTEAELSAQAQDALPEDASTQDLIAFTSTERLLGRMAGFKLQEDSAAHAAGTQIEGAPKQVTTPNQS